MCESRGAPVLRVGSKTSTVRFEAKKGGPICWVAQLLTITFGRKSQAWLRGPRFSPLLGALLFSAQGQLLRVSRKTVSN